MRSRPELEALAQQHGIVPAADWRREDIMDALRAKLGTFDPSVQLDPMKATDLKTRIDWTLSGAARFKGIAEYLTPSWMLEPKLDGARLRMFLGTTKNSMNTGRRSDVSMAYIERADNFPHMANAVIPELAGTVLDGELMPPKSSIRTMSGITTQGTLNSAMALVNINPQDSIRTQEFNGLALYYVFDIVQHKGESVMNLSYDTRRELLKVVVAKLSVLCPEIKIIPQFAADADSIQACLDAGFEGAMLKRRAGRYQAGKRSQDWLKVKTMSTGDFYVIGSVPGKGKNTGKVGSLKVAYRGAMGEDVYVADVGAFTDAFRDELTGPDGNVDPKWLNKVIEVMAQCRTKNDRLRHPHFVCLRPDKTPADCGVEQLAPFPIS